MVSLYQIRNTVNGKLYFGKTSRTVPQRWAAHCKSARAGAPWAIARAIRKYGPSAFDIKLLANVDTEQEANDLERQFIYANETHKPENGYNLTLGGVGRRLRKAGIKIRGRHEVRLGRPCGNS